MLAIAEVSTTDSNVPALKDRAKINRRYAAAGQGSLFEVQPWNPGRERPGLEFGISGSPNSVGNPPSEAGGMPPSGILILARPFKAGTT